MRITEKSSKGGGGFSLILVKVIDSKFRAQNLSKDYEIARQRQSSRFIEENFYYDQEARVFMLS